MKNSSVNKLDNFIGGWYIDKDICTNLIDYFEKSNDKKEGRIGLPNGEVGVDKLKKSCTDVIITSDLHNQIFSEYYNELNKVVTKYKEKYKYCNDLQSNWGLVENWGIQKYQPDEGYFFRHYEKTGGPYIKRHLVFMTYLNDVSDGGETEFYYQKLKVKPETGLTLIWPAEWTFTHNGVTSPTQTKYIATGWYSYV